MQIFKRFFELYIFGNIHVAIATWALTKLTLFQLNINEGYTAIFVASSTLVSYNFIRLYRFQTIDSWFSQWIAKNRKSLITLLIIGLLGMLFTLFYIPLKAFLVLIPFSFLTIFYCFPLGAISIRKIPFVKIFAIAISWAGATVLFPLASINADLWTNEIVILFLQRFFFTIIITIPFDIRDISYDKMSLQTLPQVIGIKNSKLLGIVFIFGFLYWSTYSCNTINVTMAFLLFFGLVFANNKQHKYYSAFFIESIPIIWYFLILNYHCIHIK
jgi:hypothetical protein